MARKSALMLLHGSSQIPFLTAVDARLLEGGSVRTSAN